MMKARADDRRIFDSGVQPNVLAIQESKGLDAKGDYRRPECPDPEGKGPAVQSSLRGDRRRGDAASQPKELVSQGRISRRPDILHLIQLFDHGKTFGSLIQVPDSVATKLSEIAERTEKA